MRTEDDLRAAVNRQLEMDAGLDVEGARRRVGTKVRRARAVRGGVAALALVGLVGIGALVSQRLDSPSVRVLPAERIELSLVPLTPDAHACAAQDGGSARAVAEGRDGPFRWVLVDSGAEFRFWMGGQAQPGCGQVGFNLGLTKKVDGIEFGASGGDPREPHLNAFGGAVTKEATAVEVLYRNGARRVVDVIDAGSAGANVYLVFHDDELSPGPVLREGVARVTALRGTKRIAHADNIPEVPALACAEGEGSEWAYGGMDPEHPEDWLVQAATQEGAVSRAMAAFYDKEDRVDTEEGLIQVVRSGNRVKGLFSVSLTSTEQWGVRWNVRCAPR